MRPKWMQDAEGESNYGSVGGSLLKSLLMGVGIAAAVDFLIAKKKKNKADFTVQDERDLKELQKQQKAGKKGSIPTRGMNLKDAIKAAKKKK